MDLIFKRQSIDDVILIEPEINFDDRGYFLETFRHDLFEDIYGKSIKFVQESESKSNKGVLRGLHYQVYPYAQAKLVRVIEGEILDVAVDIRKDSSTYGKHVTCNLSDNNKHQLFIPHGFAHGFIVLSDCAIVSYKVDNYYSPEHENGIAFNDKKLSIDWKMSLSKIQLSDKDKKHPNFKYDSHSLG